jgi:hypothetical protein
LGFLSVAVSFSPMQKLCLTTVGSFRRQTTRYG